MTFCYYFSNGIYYFWKIRIFSENQRPKEKRGGYGGSVPQCLCGKKGGSGMGNNQ